MITIAWLLYYFQIVPLFLFSPPVVPARVEYMNVNNR